MQRYVKFRILVNQTGSNMKGDYFVVAGYSHTCFLRYNQGPRGHEVPGKVMKLEKWFQAWKWFGINRMVWKSCFDNANVYKNPKHV